MTLAEKIQTSLIGSSFSGTADMAEIISKLIGIKTVWRDTCIADGADDDETEDQYIMRSCFSTENNSLVINVYYGDVTEEINYVDVSEPAV